MEQENSFAIVRDFDGFVINKIPIILSASSSFINISNKLAKDKRVYTFSSPYSDDDLKHAVNEALTGVSTGGVNDLRLEEIIEAMLFLTVLVDGEHKVIFSNEYYRSNIIAGGDGGIQCYPYRDSVVSREV